MEFPTIIMIALVVSLLVPIGIALMLASGSKAPNHPSWSRELGFAGLALVGPPVAAFLTLLAGVALGRVRNGPMWLLLTLLLMGPVAMTAATCAATVPAVRLWHTSRAMCVLYLTSEFAATWLVLSRAFRHFVTSWR